MPPFTGWGASRDFPRPAVIPFRAVFNQYLQPTPASDQISKNKPLPAETNPPTRERHLPTATEHRTAVPAEPVATVDLVKRFSAEVESLGGQVLHCTVQQAGARILALLKEMDIQRIQAWAADRLPQEVTRSLLQAGISLQTEPDPQIQAGLTGVHAAAADTGSLALTSAPGQPLTASLLPETHIACLKAQDIVPTLADLLNQPWISQAANTVLISGPSRTADIEMTLTIGVHGPKQLIVVCIENSPSPAGRRSG